MSGDTERPPLEIKSEELRKNLLALFEEMSENASVRESFIRNPTRYITERVSGTELPPQQTSEANRLLFSLIANDDMLDWLENYEKDNPGRNADKSPFMMDFAKKITELGDENIVASLISNAALGYGIPGLTSVAYQCVVRELPNKYDCACTPVAKDREYLTNIDPGMLRSVTEHLISNAKRLSEAGVLADLRVSIG